MNHETFSTGLQKKVKELNPLAPYVPCASHCLNLSLAHAAASCQIAQDYFTFIERVYKFFKVQKVKEFIPKNFITLKHLCPTRWEARFHSVRPFEINLDSIVNVLKEVSSNESELKIVNEAFFILNKITSIEFIFSTRFWYELLKKVQELSLKTQLVETNLVETRSKVEELKDFLVDIQPKFNCFLKLATEKAKKFDKNVSLVRQSPFLDAETFLQTQYFMNVINVFQSRIEHYFESFFSHCEKFDFLFKIQSINEVDLWQNVSNLDNFYTYNEQRDCPNQDLYNQIIEIRSTEEKLENPMQILDYIKRMNFSRSDFTALINACLLYLVTPVSVATGERSFSKLKLIKTHLRTSMAQPRLRNLSIISVERKTLKTIDIDEFSHSYMLSKIRKTPFLI